MLAHTGQTYWELHVQFQPEQQTTASEAWTKKDTNQDAQSWGKVTPANRFFIVPSSIK